MVEKGIRGGIFHSIYRYAKANNKYMKDYNKNKESSYIHEESDEGYSLEFDVQYLEKLHELHNDLPFLPERMKIRKVEKLVPNLYDKTE